MYLPEYEESSVATETVRTVLDAVLRGNANTRNQIAEQCKISAMTVGKAVRVLLRAQLLIEREAPTPRGRRPLCLFPSERLHSLTVFLTPKRASVILCATEGRILEQTAIPYCDSLPWEGNLARLRSACELCLARNGRADTGVGLGVVLRDDCALGNYAMNVLTQILHPDVVEWERDLLTRELSREEYGASVLYVSVGKTVTPMLIMGQNALFSSCSEATQSKDTLLDAIARILSVFPISRVVAEAEDGFATYAQEFLQALTERLPEKQRDGIRMPSFDDRRIALFAIERELRCRYAQTWLK